MGTVLWGHLLVLLENQSVTHVLLADIHLLLVSLSAILAHQAATYHPLVLQPQFHVLLAVTRRQQVQLSVFCQKWDVLHHPLVLLLQLLVLLGHMPQPLVFQSVLNAQQVVTFQTLVLQSLPAAALVHTHRLQELLHAMYVVLAVTHL